MNTAYPNKIKRILIVCVLLGGVPAWAYNSGSTGADGVFAPSADIEVPLPASGIFNYVSVDVPAGVTVTFTKNAGNTPVIWLVQGDANIAGTIDVRGQSSGQSGPGGFNGGPFGTGANDPGTGFGPGGGNVDIGQGSCYGGHGVYSEATQSKFSFNCAPATRDVYGRAEIVPFLGGSGGAGGSGAAGGEPGSAGGGGGGAMLIAASGTIDVSGSILADGAAALDISPGGCGGGGSGGAIKLVATQIIGEGALSADSPPALCTSISGAQSQAGDGRIRLEAETLTRSSATVPAFSTGLPGPIFIPNFPTISITSIAGVAVPANPTGMNDVAIPAATPNPMDVVFSTINVPLGSVIDLRVQPFQGEAVTVQSPGITGTEASGTDTVSVTIPDGASTLSASVVFTVDSTAGLELAPYADGQLVAKIRSSYSPGIGAVTTLITEDGQEYDWPSSALGIN